VLRSAVADAQAMASILEHKGFTVTALYNDQATKQAIRQAQDDLALQVTPEDRVLVFFAGHSSGPEHGEVMEYLIPYDGTDIVNYISMGELRNWGLRQDKAKHQLFFLHTKYGSLSSAPGERADTSKSPDGEDVTQRIARQILVSGVEHSLASTGTAPPLSPFMTAIREALQGEQADTNDDCYVLVPELMHYLRQNGFKTLSLRTFYPHAGGEFAFRVERRLEPSEIEARLRKETRSLCGLDLQGFKLQESDLGGRDLREANLSNAELGQANLQGADLWQAKLANANLLDARLQGARLSRANLAGARLQKANLQGADLNKADLRGANLEEAQLPGAVLSEATLTGADLIGADLSGAELIRANLSGALLDFAKLNHAKLGRASLREVTLSKTELSDADFRDADVAALRFDPQPEALPSLAHMEQAEHLDEMTCDKSPSALTALREAFRQAGMSDAAQQVMSAITRCEARLAEKAKLEAEKPTE
jgi:uncharacterized protein YjbI with pentapeptide repeats